MTTPNGITPAPEAAVIQRARKRHIPRLSQRAAAEKAGLSPTRWRDIESGWHWVRKGEAETSSIPPATTAVAAYAVGATPAELREAGCHEAASELQHLIDAHSTANEDIDLSTVPSSALLNELATRVGCHTVSYEDNNEMPPLHLLAARKVEPKDRSTWRR